MNRHHLTPLLRKRMLSAAMALFIGASTAPAYAQAREVARLLAPAPARLTTKGPK